MDDIRQQIVKLACEQERGELSLVPSVSKQAG